jgi:hypothetical protein
MTTPLSTTDAAREPTVWNFIGWALIATAFVFTVWASLKVGNAFTAGQRMGQLLATWGVFALIAWLVTRNKSSSVRASARIVIGVLLWIVVAVNFNGDATEKKVGQAFLRDAIAMNKSHIERFQVLNARFASTDLSTVLTPANVTTAAGIASGREKVAQSKALIAERDALLQKNFDDIRKLVADLPEGATKAGAQGVVGARRDETVRVFKDLSKTQLAHLDVIGQILDWCAAQGDKLRNVGGQLQYTSNEQADELKALLDKLAMAETTANKAVEVATALEKRTEEKKVRSLKQATELLK